MRGGRSRLRVLYAALASMALAVATLGARPHNACPFTSSTAADAADPHAHHADGPAGDAEPVCCCEWCFACGETSPVRVGARRALCSAAPAITKHFAPGARGAASSRIRYFLPFAHAPPPRVTRVVPA